MKKIFIAWAIAFLGVITVPIAGYVMGSTTDACPDGSDSCEPEYDYYINPNPPQTQEAGEWADAFVQWCIDDTYDHDECVIAGDAFERVLNAHLAGQSTKDPRVNYPAYYPGGSKNTVPNPTPPARVVHPGKVQEPIPKIPSRSPSRFCTCHWGDPTVHETYVYLRTLDYSA